MSPISETASAYLSGWEYNRLLQQDPLASRVSSLPAEALWHGAHQFWMFRTVYCTSESLENEFAAASELGWATATIFRDLVADGFLKAVDWSRLAPDVRTRMDAVHEGLRSRYPEQIVRHLIAERNTSELEQIKAELLQPILEELGAIAAGSPNSLDTWIARDAPRPDTTPPNRTSALLAQLAAPVLPGLSACTKPGTGLSEADRARQATAQAEVETPLISELVAGDGAFSGRKGYEPYLEALRSRASDYEPANRAILNEWKANRARLSRLRDAAEKHLWSDLHSDWLPALLTGQLNPEKFEQYISTAVHHRQFLRLVDSEPIRILVGRVPVAAASAITLASAALLTKIGVDPGPAGVAAIASAALGDVVRERLATPRAEIVAASRLAVFYQQACTARNQ